MTQEEKLDLLVDKISTIETISRKQCEQLDYIVSRLDHMSEKAHMKKEKETNWPS